MLRPFPYLRLVTGSLALCIAFLACRHDDEDEPEVTDTFPPEAYAGGATTVFSSGADAYLYPAANISAANAALFAQGEDLFHQVFQPLGNGEPSGLGPQFIHFACAECHLQNGRSHPPFDEGDNSSGLLMRISVPGAGEYGEPLGVPGFGTQLQTLAIDGVQAEGKFYVTYETVPVAFPDGYSVNLRQPYFIFYDLYEDLPGDLLRSGRNAPPVFGLGLLEAIPEETILAMADENDQDGDGISGKPNYCWDTQTNSLRLGRFGWKSSHPTVIQQTAGAFVDDMGMTSVSFFPLETCLGQSNCTEGIGAEPDLSLAHLQATAAYASLLAVPASRDHDDPIVQRGKEVFSEIYCDDCHVPQLTTGPSIYPELSNQVIYPYTDLLLHDLGEGLGDGRPDYEASANEWRTPPLWGIGLSLLVSPQGSFLHDGRAATLEEAILWHGGEAYWSREDYMALSAADRAALIRFLESL